MNTRINLYELLGVNSDADETEIKKAYRKLAAKTHPDVGGEAMVPLFRSIQGAYETLSDPQKRKEYDRSLEEPREPTGGTQRRTANNAEPHRGTTRRRNTEPPSYDWDWVNSIAPMTKFSFKELLPKTKSDQGTNSADVKLVRARYTQRFPFMVIFSIAVMIWLLSLGLRNSAPLPAEVLSAPMFKLLGVLQAAHLIALLVAVFARKLKALKTFICSLVALVHLVAPSIILFGATRKLEFVPPSALAVATTVALIASSIAIVWSLYERGNRSRKMKATGIPRKVNDWVLIDLAKAGTVTPAVAHARMISEMVAGKLPGTKILYCLPGKAGKRNEIIVINGKRLALVEVMDISDRGGNDDISGYRWDEFPWNKSVLGSKPAVLQDMLPKDIEVRSFLMVYPAHYGVHSTTYKMGAHELKVSAVSDVALGNVMGQWLAAGDDAGAVDKDLLYGLVTREPLSTFL